MSEEPKTRPLLPSVVRWLTQGTQGRWIAGMDPPGERTDPTHLIEMAEAIQRCYDGESHGGFVTAMARGDYSMAFRNADRVNARYFGALMEFRIYYMEDHRS